MARRDDWGTPQWLYDRLDSEFGFDLDAAASDWNAKCPEWLGDCLADDPWPGAAPVWLNPPYRRDLLTKILDRAWEECCDGRVVVVLLPVRSEMPWWSKVIRRASEIRFIQGRVAFVPPPGHELSKAGNRPVYPSAVAVFRCPRRPVKLGIMVAPKNHRSLWS